MSIQLNFIKHKQFILGLVFLIGFNFNDINAQVTIGPGWMGNHAISSQAPGDAVPYNYNDKSVHIQLLYSQNDLATGGASGAFTIDSLGWYLIDHIAGPLTNYTIKMKNTSATNTQVYDNVGLTLVRNAADLAPATDSAWYMIALNTPFLWDGTSNLLIDVCWGLNPNSSATGRIRHFSQGSSFERILVKSNFNNTCNSTPAQTAAFKPYLRLTEGQPTQIKEQTLSNFLIVPNPSNGLFSIQGLTNESIQVMNALGETVLIENDNNQSIDMSAYAKGVYFVKAIDKQGAVKALSKLFIE
jgi:hypothetical protein